jgi:hypothetical protein
MLSHFRENGYKMVYTVSTAVMPAPNLNPLNKFELQISIYFFELLASKPIVAHITLTEDNRDL